jgi:hypothetical protein
MQEVFVPRETTLYYGGSMFFRTSIIRSAISLAIAAAVSLSALGLLSGCGIGTETAETQTAVSAISGTVHGGQSPIQGAVVVMYSTNPAATTYGAAGVVVGQGTSDVNGNFIISPSVTATTCPATQQAYLVAIGGYPSGSSSLNNTSSTLVAALGPCSGVGSATRAIINEVTTVAAAYALSGFATTSAYGTTGYTVNVSAPAANNATTASLTAALGLPHAFVNAATLANATIGQANSQTSNSVAGTTVNGSVPLAEINTLADILQSCVNGATGNASCVSLYGFTPSISGVAPSNTFQAMVNLARNPYPSTAAMTAASGLFSLVSGSPAFVPALTAQPPDWSLAVVYKGTALVGPYDISLDASDTVFYGASGAANIIGLSAYGIATPVFSTGSAGTATRQLAPDVLGNVWVTNNGTLLLQYSATGGGAPTTAATLTGGDTFGVAVDKSNNVWLANAVTTGPNITEYAYAAGTPATYTAGYTATAAGGFEPVELTIDANQNIWASAYYTNGNTADVIPNLTPAGTASYPSTGTPVSAVFASTALKPLGVVIDASGNAWYGITGSNSVTTTGIEEVIPTFTSSVITSIAPQTLIANATLGAKASQIPGIDGAGSVYLPDNQGTGALGVHVYSTVAVTSSDTGGQVLSPPSGYLGCYLSTAATTTCATGSSSAVYNPREIQIDSTGSVWAGITSGGLTQLIGLGAPSWPLLQSGKPGLSPGLSTVTPLP